MKEKPVDQNKETDLPFEKAFIRLEEILEKMNSGETSLDESLRLFEEGDRLITACSKRLNDAERRVEQLIKNRNGDLALDSEGRPVMTEFQSPPANGMAY